LLMLYNPTQLSESCKGYHRLLIYVLNIYLLHAVRIYSILRYFYAVLDCASMKANILHFQTCTVQVQLSSLGQASGIQDRCCRKPTSCSQRLLSVHPNFGCRHHYCYDVEPHEQRQPSNLQIHSIHTH
ncbi:hypothetical protein T01_16163, partial [Trichinella spiralis]